MFPSRDLAIEGKADKLNPYYYYLNQIFRATMKGFASLISFGMSGGGQ
jgi:hypothetical protein